MSSRTKIQLDNSKYPFFAKQLLLHLQNNQIPAKPITLANALNSHYGYIITKPHTVRKWLLGLTQPKSQTLLLLAGWLNVAPKDLITPKISNKSVQNRVSIEFDFTDQEVVANYLSMTAKQKLTVRLLIDAITDKNQ